MRTLSTGAFLLAVSAAVRAGAVPTVTEVAVCDLKSKYAEITYALSEPAVVTLDIQTNCTDAAGSRWVSIGGEHIATFSADSDVFRRVDKAQGRIRWNTKADFFGRKIEGDGIRAVVTAWPLGDTPDYMVVDIDAAAQPNTQRYYPSVEFLPGGLLANKAYRKTKLVLKKVKAKNVSWTTGSLVEPKRVANNEYAHRVTLTNNYYLGVFPMTQAQSKDFYTAPMFTHADGEGMRPEDRVCYNVLFCKTTTADAGYLWPNVPKGDSSLGKLRTRTGLDFTLPSEAEWEFACRAGHWEGLWNDGSRYVGSSADDYRTDANLALLGRYRYNGGYRDNGATAPTSMADCANWGVNEGTAVVGSYRPNDWGFYDMHGNVLEWCLDWYADDISGLDGRVNVDPTDATKTLSGAAASARVMRGGTYALPASQVRSAWRTGMVASTPYYEMASSYPRGYRVCCRAGLE